MVASTRAEAQTLREEKGRKGRKRRKCARTQAASEADSLGHETCMETFQID